MDHKDKNDLPKFFSTDIIIIIHFLHKEHEINKKTIIRTKQRQQQQKSAEIDRKKNNSNNNNKNDN